MDSNNLNYGNSTNSGLKLSSGDSLYTNGSSMSFHQQGKNLNGEMNVNGVTTVHGSSVSGSHPPSTSYPHVSGHHQIGASYNYLWGGHPQYGPGMGTSSGQGPHQKQPAPGIAHPQSQHNFQGHGQYQLNGGVEASHQPPVTGPANIPLTGSSEYWNRSNPGSQQMTYNSPSMYGTFQSRSHPGVTPSPHHQQQTLQQSAHQPSQQALLSHHHPHHQHHQQQQHFSMMTNGMPFYQHQSQPPSLPSPLQQPQSHTHTMPPAAQNFTPPRGSPQHHSLGRGSSGSPLPVGILPPPIQDGGSPKGISRDRSPHTSSSGISSPLQGLSREVDASQAGSEKSPVAHRSPKTDGYQLKPYAPQTSPKRDHHHQYSDQPGVQRPEVKPAVRDIVVSSHLQQASSPRSTLNTVAKLPPTNASTQPGVSASSGSPTSASERPVGVTGEVEVPFPSSSVASSRISSPVVVQGLRSPSRTSEPSTLRLKRPPQGHSSALLQSHSSPSNESKSVGAVCSEFLVAQTKTLLPPTASKPTCISSPAEVLPPSFTNAFGSQHEIPAPPKLISAPLSATSSSPSVTSSLTSSSAHSLSMLPVPSLSGSAAETPSVGGKLSEHTSASQYQKRTPSAVDASLSTAVVASTPPRLVKAPSLVAQTSPSVRPPFTLPLVTTQASRTAPLSNPPALVSMPTVMGTSPIAVGNADKERPLPDPTSSSECHVPREELENRRNGKPEENPRQLELDVIKTSHVTGVGTKKPEVCLYKSPPDLSEKWLQTSEQNPRRTSTDLEKHQMQSSVLSDVADSPVASTPIGKPLHPNSTRLQNPTNEQSFDYSDNTASYYDDESTYNTSSRFAVSSLLGDSTHLDTSQADGLSCAEEEQSATFDSSAEASFSADDSRDDTIESTRGEETSEADVTRNSQMTEGSMLESSLNATAQTEDLPVDSSHVNNSHLIGSSQPSLQDSEGDWDPSGRDAPDSAGHDRHLKGNANEPTTPSVTALEDNLVASSTPVESAIVHPFRPVTEQTGEAAGDVVKAAVKRRRSRAPKAVPITPAAPEVKLRKPRVRTAKAEKMKAIEVAGIKEEGPVGRKRKKPLKVDVKETMEASGEAGSPAQELDPIMAAINAVLANGAALSTVARKPKKMKRVRKQDQHGRVAGGQKRDAEAIGDNENDDDSSTAGDSNRRRVATEEQVQFPLQHGWKREIRVKKLENRMKGETWYYTPCGRRMKQFPEIIKYLKKHSDGVVSREHFSFSPRMPVGDFYEERETSEGSKWVLLANEEVPSTIMAITGRRGRPPNPDKEKPQLIGAPKGGQARRPGRPPKFNAVDLLSKVDAKLLNRLEAKEALTEEEKEKLAKIKKKMKKKARMKRREDLKIKKMKEEKKKAKLEQDLKVPEGVGESTDTAVPRPAHLDSATEPKKPGRQRRAVKVEAATPVQQPSEEKVAQSNRAAGARSKAKALAKAKAEAEAAAQAALAAKRAAERRAQAQRRLEERKRQQLITEELKKPTEDMCLTDHKPLPELSRVPGLVLSGTSFAHCLAVVEFLHAYGKIIGLNVPKDIPSLSTLQEGLLGLGDSQGEVQDLLLKLMEAALHDPGLPSYYQSVKILGEKLVDLELTRSTVSEVLRIYLESHGYETEVCNTLRTKTFHVLPPDTKAAILGFLVEELNGSNIVISDIDNTLENMSTYRKNKWIIERKLRKLKSVLARRTGRSEEELCFEERRRSARVAEEENYGLEESGIPERGSRRTRKEEPKLSDSESPTTASIPELEKQIDKLTKRQAFFRKKLLQSSHSMRVIPLGQDRYRRRYLAFPHLGGVLVEGPEELLTSGEVFVAEVPVTFLKKEPKVEEIVEPTTPPANECSATPSQPQMASVEDDPLPGTASLMSSQRGRGRPRKIKPEVELHLRTAKIRRRRRTSARSVGDEGPGSPNSGLVDLTQAAFQSWLSHSKDAMTNGSCLAAGEAVEGNRSEESIKEMAEKRGQWFNLLPKQPCDEDSLAEPQTAVPLSSPPKLLPQIPSALPALAAPLMEHDPPLPDLAPADAGSVAAPSDVTPTDPAHVVPPSVPPMNVQPPPASSAPPPTAPVTPARPGRRRRRGSRGSSPARRGARGAAAKRRGRPPNAVFQELEQQYFTQLVVKPIPASMVRGWWWIKDPQELYSTLQALHPRGIREKVLHKHLAKHMESLAEMCTKPINDRLFELKTEDKEVLLEALQQPWQVQEKAMEVDISALQWVEDLEQRVVAADLHLKAPPQGALNEPENDTETPVTEFEFQPYTIPDPDSTRNDLQYYEHDVDPRDDWIVRTKKEWSGLPRIASHPVDLAVLRLANLERNIERRYLKEPLWNPSEVMRLAPLTPTPGEELSIDVFSLESEITSRLRTWRQALDRCRSAPQLLLCLFQLEKAIAWERSVTKVTCQVCRKGDNDDSLLLCDGCDRGCHMYCLKPKITEVPEGDWFCPSCVPKMEGEPQDPSNKRTRLRKRRYEEDSSEDETTRRRSGGMTTRHKEPPAPPSSSARYSGEGGGSKRRRMTTRNQPDLTFCEIILMEMEAHADALPFLEPVNPRLVPGYRRIVKNPMDFLTMRERLLQGAYCSCEEFAADAELVFNNCELFNEDTSEVGMAGHSMRRFFKSRWAEFYSNKDK